MERRMLDRMYKSIANGTEVNGNEPPPEKSDSVAGRRRKPEKIHTEATSKINKSEMIHSEAPPRGAHANSE